MKDLDEEGMGDYKVRYRNAKFSNQKIELDGKSFIHCEFQDCITILERGETEISGCSFKNCKLMLKGNAYTVGRIIKLFTPAAENHGLWPRMNTPTFGRDVAPLWL
jgi:ribosomal protein L37AE/L43A